MQLDELTKSISWGFLRNAAHCLDLVVDLDFLEDNYPITSALLDIRLSFPVCVRRSSFYLLMAVSAVACVQLMPWNPRSKTQLRMYSTHKL